MAKKDDRMEQIGSAILSQANQEARELIDKANATRQQEISGFNEAVVEKMFIRMQAKASNIRITSVKTIAKNQLDAHRELLTHRTQKTDEVFLNVRKRLQDFTKTQEYKQDILTRAAALKDDYDHESSVILVRECDKNIAEEIKRELGGKAEIKSDVTIEIGGFKLKNSKARILVDETLDERLEEQKKVFLQNCGLKIN